jgi:hypothetical protein
MLLKERKKTKNSFLVNPKIRPEISCDWEMILSPENGKSTCCP